MLDNDRRGKSAWSADSDTFKFGPMGEHPEKCDEPAKFWMFDWHVQGWTNKILTGRVNLLLYNLVQETFIKPLK